MQANKEEDDKMRATAANVAARAAVGGDDMLSKWQLMAEQARQKREGLDGPSSSQSGKTTSSRPSPGLKRNLREQHETQRRGSSSHSISGKCKQILRSSFQEQMYIILELLSFRGQQKIWEERDDDVSIQSGTQYF